MNYEIGQEVWWARFDTVETSVECPDCVGSGYIRCIMGDGTEVTIDCQNCHIGYEQFSRGRIRTYERTPRAEKTKITGMDVTSTKTEYRIPSSYIVEEDRLWLTEEAALEMAQILADEASKQELERIACKEKDTKSWAWNATYHRGCIRRAQKDIEYHTRKLDVAREKAKVQHG
jgi:hypothetical protein